MALSTSDLHWLAGLFEGEGCVLSVRSKGTVVSLCLQIRMTDEDVLLKAATILDTRLTGPYLSKQLRKDGTPKKLSWRISVTGSHAVAWGMTLYNLLGKRRRQRLSEVLVSWRLAENRQYRRKRVAYASKVPSDRECRDSD